MDFNWKNALIGLAGGVMGRPLLPLELQEIQAEQEKRNRLNTLLDLQTKIAQGKYERGQKLPEMLRSMMAPEPEPTGAIPVTPPPSVAPTILDYESQYLPKESLTRAQPGYEEPSPVYQEGMQSSWERPSLTAQPTPQPSQPAGQVGQTNSLADYIKTNADIEKKKLKFISEHADYVGDENDLTFLFQLAEKKYPKTDYKEIGSLIDLSRKMGTVPIPYGGQTYNIPSDVAYPKIAEAATREEPGRYETVMEGGKPINKFFPKSMPATDIYNKDQWIDWGHGQKKNVVTGDIVKVPVKPEKAEKPFKESDYRSYLTQARLYAKDMLGKNDKFFALLQNTGSQEGAFNQLESGLSPEERKRYSNYIKEYLEQYASDEIVSEFGKRQTRSRGALPPQKTETAPLWDYWTKPKGQEGIGKPKPVF